MNALYATEIGIIAMLTSSMIQGTQKFDAQTYRLLKGVCLS